MKHLLKLTMVLLVLLGAATAAFSQGRFHGQLLSNKPDLTQEGKLIVEDSLRVNLASEFVGAVTFRAAASLNGNLTGVDKLVIDDSLRVGKESTFNDTVTFNYLANFNGPVSSGAKITNTDGGLVVADSFRTEAATFNGVLTFARILADTNAFTTDATSDTVLISGALGTDIYLLTNRGATVDTADVLTAHALTDTLIVTREGGTSGRKYAWFRFR